MSTDENLTVSEGRKAKGPWGDQDRLALRIGVVYLPHLVASVGITDGKKSPRIKGAAFPFQVVLAPDVTLKADKVNGLSGFRVSHGIGHVVPPERVADLDPEPFAHEFHDLSLLVEFVATLAVRVEALDLAFRSVAGSP